VPVSLPRWALLPPTRAHARRKERSVAPPAGFGVEWEQQRPLVNVVAVALYVNTSKEGNVWSQ
jgi:hypothetical protein